MVLALVQAKIHAARGRAMARPNMRGTEARKLIYQARGNARFQNRQGARNAFGNNIVTLGRIMIEMTKLSAELLENAAERSVDSRAILRRLMCSTW